MAVYNNNIQTAKEMNLFQPKSIFATVCIKYIVSIFTARYMTTNPEVICSFLCRVAKKLQKLQLKVLNRQVGIEIAWCVQQRVQSCLQANFQLFYMNSPVDDNPGATLTESPEGKQFPLNLVSIYNEHVKTSRNTSSVPTVNTPTRCNFSQ